MTKYMQAIIQELRGCRLMLYAWLGSRPKKWGPHPELERTIESTEALLDRLAVPHD